MQLTRERAITLHRRMWRWIGLKTLREKRCVRKEEWFERFGLKTIYSDCYCCEYARQFFPYSDWRNTRCFYCPIDWGVKRDCCGEGALFKLWCHEIDMENWQEAGKLALQIVELPEKEELHSERII